MKVFHTCVAFSEPIQKERNLTLQLNMSFPSHGGRSLGQPRLEEGHAEKFKSSRKRQRTGRRSSGTKGRIISAI